MQIAQQSTIGKRLHDLRKYRNLSLQELSDLTGISRSNLNRYERDISKPTSEYLKILCQFYKVSADYLLFGVAPDILTKEGWSRFDPELREMVERLAALMTSESPHLRSWAIVQFAEAFRGKAKGRGL